MTILEVPTLYERFYWHHHNCYHSASLTRWLVKMWLMYSMVDIMRTPKLYFILSNDEVAFEMLCNPCSIWLFCCRKSLLKVSMQPFSLQNTILQSWQSTCSFFFFRTLVVAFYRVNSLISIQNSEICSKQTFTMFV